MPNNIPRRHSLVGSKVQIFQVDNFHKVCSKYFMATELCLMLWAKIIFVVRKAAILKNPDLGQFKKLLHWKAHMPKPIPRHQNHPSSFSSFEVMSKNVYFGSQKRPSWKIQISDRVENCSIGKLICQILFLDTKISLLALIVLKLSAKMYILGPKSGHFE